LANYSQEVWEVFNKLKVYLARNKLNNHNNPNKNNKDNKDNKENDEDDEDDEEENEEEVKKQKEKIQKLREESVANLGKGVTLTKVPRQGKAKPTMVYLTRDDTVKGKWVLRWDSKNKAKDDARIVLQDCQLKLGHKSGMFLEKNAKKLYDESLCFSLVDKKRSLDLVCSSKKDVASWVDAFDFLLQLKPTP